MDRIPCRVEQDTRRYYRDQDRAQAEYADSLEARRWEALQALSDPEKLKEVLNDAELALPLSDCFRSLQRAIDGDHLAVHTILSAVSRMEKSCFDWLRGDE